jgi:hypothetical protein
LEQLRASIVKYHPLRQPKPGYKPLSLCLDIINLQIL